MLKKGGDDLKGHFDISPFSAKKRGRALSIKMMFYLPTFQVKFKNQLIQFKNVLIFMMTTNRLDLTKGVGRVGGGSPKLSYIFPHN